MQGVYLRRIYFNESKLFESISNYFKDLLNAFKKGNTDYAKTRELIEGHRANASRYWVGL